MNKVQKVLNLLESLSETTIATVNDKRLPEAAWIGFAEKDDLTLIFGTETTSRKYHNIQAESSVALVFGNDTTTVQYEGVCTQFTDEELEEYKEIYFTKTPGSRKYETMPNQIYLKIVPKWLRYTDYSEESPEIFELTF